MKKFSWPIGLVCLLSGFIGCEEPGEVPVWGDREPTLAPSPTDVPVTPTMAPEATPTEVPATPTPEASETPEVSPTACPDQPTATPSEGPYVDEDGDLHTTQIDCNDQDPSINTSATEVCGDGIDQDCDGADEVCSQVTPTPTPTPVPTPTPAPSVTDNDLDGYTAQIDCNDGNASIHPNATDVCGDGIDQNCYGGDEVCATPTPVPTPTPTPVPTPTPIPVTDADKDGYNVGSDCNDNNASVHPGAAEQCNSVDDNCDGLVDNGVTTTTWYRDVDGDTYGTGASTTVGCKQPAGYVSRSGDCNDANTTINPGATETCNNVDDNCNGSIDEGVSTTSYYVDGDSDGYGKMGSTATVACAKPTGYVANNTDCVDTNATVHPNATETCNNVDDDCDGSIDDGTSSASYYIDSDKDGYGKAGSPATVACAKPTGYVANSTDCADTNASIYPGATETLNGVDDDCDGSIDELWMARVQVQYPNTGTYELNATVFSSAATIGSVGWTETSKVSLINTVQVNFTAEHYGEFGDDFCGVRFNVSVGSPAATWLCQGNKIDPAASVDIWWHYQKGWVGFNDESKLRVWEDKVNGGCSVVLITSTEPQCQF